MAAYRSQRQNWWLIGGIIAGIAIIATLIWQLVTHRKAS